MQLISRLNAWCFSREMALDMTVVLPTCPGEGCIALRLEATETLLPIYTPLTHHGEMTGHFRGEIKLQTSQGKTREKLYGEWARALPCSLFSAAGLGTGKTFLSPQPLRVLSAVASEQKSSITRDVRDHLARFLTDSRMSLQNRNIPRPHVFVP